MRSPGYLVAFMLTVLLASTTPVGTGAGVHQFQLMHPVFDHVHIVNGRVLTHEQLEQRVSSAPKLTPGPAFGAGSPPVSDDAGMGVSPMLPLEGLAVVGAVPRPWNSADPLPPRNRTEAPPTLPPLA